MGGCGVAVLPRLRPPLRRCQTWRSLRRARRRRSGGRRWGRTATPRPPIARPHARTHAWGRRARTLRRTGTGRRRRRSGKGRRYRPRRRRRRTPWGNAEGAAGAGHTSHHRGHSHGRCGCCGARLRRLLPAAGRCERRRSAWANAHEAPPPPLCVRRGHGRGGPSDLARGGPGSNKGRLSLHPKPVPLGGERGVPAAILRRRGHDTCLRRPLHESVPVDEHEEGAADMHHVCSAEELPPAHLSPRP